MYVVHAIILTTSIRNISFFKNPLFIESYLQLRFDLNGSMEAGIPIDVIETVLAGKIVDT